MDRDLKELLSTLNAHKVRYLVVGAYAVAFHSEPRATKDMDVWVATDPENAASTFAALKEFGFQLQGISVADFSEPGSFFRMGVPPNMIEILTNISGVEFSEAWERRTQFPVDGDPGFQVHVISRRDLIAAKIAAGRPIDLIDVDTLRRVPIATSAASAAAGHEATAAKDSIQKRKSRPRTCSKKPPK